MYMEDKDRRDMSIDKDADTFEPGLCRKCCRTNVVGCLLEREVRPLFHTSRCMISGKFLSANYSQDNAIVLVGEVHRQASSAVAERSTRGLWTIS